MKRWWATAILVLLGASVCHGDDLTDIRRACFERGDFHKGIRWLEECAQELFTADTAHLTLTSVAPGAGLAAFGPGFGKVQRIRRFEFVMAGTAAMSNDGSSVGQAKMTFALPTRSFGAQTSLRSAQDKYGMRAINRNPEDDPVDAKISMNLGFRRIDAREQAFYGLGPATTLGAQASYGLILTETFAGANQPLTAWSSLGFNFSFLQPRVTSSIDSSVPQIRSAYSEATAPGLTVRDDFLRYEPYVTFRIPPRRSTYSTLRVGYAYYQAMGDPHLSFQRLSGASETVIPLNVPTPEHLTPSHRTWLGKHWLPNSICPTLRSATRCSMGDLTLRAVVAASYTGAAGQVPFYFDQTLGGADMAGNDTLRGFADYRFRGPNSLLFQTEYRHPVWGPVGLLSFYDLGKVVLERSDISLDHLRHDIGLGVYLTVARHEVVRLYWGFGSGEPSRPHPKFPGAF
jgi:hypothetical protein